MESLLSELQQEFVSASQTIKTRRAKFLELYVDYDSKRADLEAVLDDVLSESRSNQEKISSIHRQLVALLTTEEWDTLQKKQGKALNAAVNALKRSI